LTKIALEKIKEWRQYMVWLDVLADNRKAILFYQENGFSNNGEHTFTIGSQAFLFDTMIKANVLCY
jgi:ribosomal protein S18 acetylase RimI-like enzyme